MNKSSSIEFLYLNEDPPIIVIPETYDIEDQTAILKEIEFLHSKLGTLEDTEPAYDENGVLLANKSGLWLGDVYANPKYSDILTRNRRFYALFENINHWYYKNITTTLKHVRDTTLLSYYENKGHYNSHVDNCWTTAITWFFRNPKNFTGGDLIFPELNIKLECKGNATVIFPSCLKHEVNEIRIIDKSIPMGGRYSISQFFRVG